MAKPVLAQWEFDNNPPNVTINVTCDGNPVASGGSCSGLSADINVVCTDNAVDDSGCKQIFYEITPAANPCNIPGTPTVVDQGGNDQNGTVGAITSLDILNNDGGSYKICARGEDNAGNTFTVSPNFTFDFSLFISGVVYVSSTCNNADPVYRGGATIDLTGDATDQATTDVNGFYFVGGLTQGGNYVATIDQVQLSSVGYNLATCSPASRTFNNLAANESGANFYVVQTPLQISGTVFVDSNHNGIWDAGELPYTDGTSLNITGGLPVTSDVNGHYSYTKFVGTYTVTLTVPANYGSTTGSCSTPETCKVTTTKTVSIPPSQTNVNFGITPFYDLTVNVYSDQDNNGAHDAPYDGNAPPVTVTLSGGSSSRPAVNNVTSSTTFTDLLSGNYTVTTTIPAGYKASTPNGTCSPSNCIGGASSIIYTPSISLSVVSATVNFYYTPLFTISGFVFIDKNKNGIKELGEDVYDQSFTVGTAGSTPSYPSPAGSGKYLFQNLTPGTHAISFVLPTSYELVCPLGGVFSVNVGKNTAVAPPAPYTCNINSANNASCYFDPTTVVSGSIQDLDFAISNSFPWFQTRGSDARIDNGFTDRIPDTPVCAGDPDASSAQSSIIGPLSNTHGVIYSGSSNPSFGEGSASTNGWQIGNSTYPETFSPVSGVIRTSYAYLLTSARQNGITPTPLTTSHCGAGGIADCTFIANLPNGIYVANGDLNLNAYTFPKLASPATNNYIILVNGNLTINDSIRVPIGSTAIFSASGDIHIAREIGGASNAACNPTTHANCYIEGFYSANRNIYLDGYGPTSCATASQADDDIRINLVGSFVTNAALNGGSFINNRDMCELNLSCPVFTITERPDLILNTPDFIKVPSYVWKETTP